jgi:DTW domain-containing protein YfiP
MALSMSDTTTHASADDEACPHCGKPPALCVCETVSPLDNRIELLVLQHPQEQDKLLGTARLAVHALKKASFRIGLSWPSLEKAAGHPADPQQWGVLYLGAEGTRLAEGKEVSILDGKGVLLPDQDRAAASLRGIVVLDGSWSQAKTLWWRNPWVLKANRIVVAPRAASLYGDLRREPRREGLSTIEAAGLVLGALESRPDIREGLNQVFARMLERYRVSGIKPPARNDFRRRGPPWRRRKTGAGKAGSKGA